MHYYTLPFYCAAIFNKTIFLSMHLLPWMNFMLDFIDTGFAVLWGTDESKNLMWDYVSSRIWTTNLFSPNRSNANPAAYTNRLRWLRCLNVLNTFTVSLHMIKMNTHVTKQVPVSNHCGKRCIGSDCQTKSAFHTPMKILSMNIFRTLHELHHNPFDTIMYLCNISPYTMTFEFFARYIYNYK